MYLNELMPTSSSPEKKNMKTEEKWNRTDFYLQAIPEKNMQLFKNINIKNLWTVYQYLLEKRACTFNGNIEKPKNPTFRTPQRKTYIERFSFHSIWVNYSLKLCLLIGILCCLCWSKLLTFFVLSTINYEFKWCHVFMFTSHCENILLYSGWESHKSKVRSWRMCCVSSECVIPYYPSYSIHIILSKLSKAHAQIINWCWTALR